MGNTGAESHAAFEGPVHRYGRDLTMPIVGLVMISLAAGVFGVLRSMAVKDATYAWANTAMPVALGLGALLAAYTIWYARSTSWRLTVHVEPPVYVLRVIGPQPLEARGPFKVTRAYTVERYGRRAARVIVLILDVVRSNGELIRFTQTLPVQPLPENWHRGLPSGSPDAIYDLPAKTNIMHLADKLGAGAGGAVDEDHIERFAALLNAPPKKKAKKKQKKASSEAPPE